MTEPYVENTQTEATPWEKSSTRLIIGIALSGITLNFWNLDTILPAIGLVLSLLGFRAMSQGNGWYQKGYYANLARVVIFLLQAILHTTILSSLTELTLLLRGAAALQTVFLFLEYYCLWKAFRDAQLKNEETAQISGSGSVVGLMIWTVLVGMLASADYEGMIVAPAMLVLYILLLRKMYRFTTALEQAGYAIEPYEASLSDRTLVLMLAGILIAGSVCGYAFGSRYPMKWQAKDSPSGTEKTIANLKNLGFPEEVLQDLTAQDLSACVEATQVITEQDTFDTDNHLRFTGVAVKLGDESEEWVVFHHFTWTENPGFPGTESLTLWPAWREVPEGWSEGRKVTGRLLCEQNGATYTAPYYALTEETNTTDTMFWGQQTRTDIIAAFSYPSKAENARGYLTYTTTQQEPDTILSSHLTYTHQHTRLQYPAKTAAEAATQSAWINNRAFTITQTGFQFYPEAE